MKPEPRRAMSCRKIQSWSASHRSAAAQRCRRLRSLASKLKADGEGTAPLPSAGASSGVTSNRTSATASSPTCAAPTSPTWLDLLAEKHGEADGRPSRQDAVGRLALVSDPR